MDVTAPATAARIVVPSRLYAFPGENLMLWDMKARMGEPLIT
jgi:hypothetical protein